MTKGMRVGYVRVSTIDQNPDRQLEGIELDKKFIEYASGKTANREILYKMISFLREGDHVIVHSIDRIARNLIDLKRIVEILNSKGISIEFKKENLHFHPNKEDPISNLTLSMMGAFAEFELAIITERRTEGIAIARSKNKYVREHKLNEQQQREVKEMLQNHVPVAKIALQYGVSRPTIYKCKKQELK